MAIHTEITKQIGSRALILLALSGLAACGAKMDVDMSNHSSAIPTAKELAAKYFPALAQTPTISPAAPSLDQDMTVAFAPTGGDIGTIVYLRPFEGGEEGQILLSSNGEGAFGITPGLESQLTPQKYTLGIVQVKGTLVSDGFTPVSLYQFDPAISKTHFVLKVQCFNESSPNNYDKCIPEYVEHGEGDGKNSKADEWEAMTHELQNGFVSEVALPFVTVGPSSVDFAASVTQVTRVDANNVDVFYTLSNAGTADAIVRYAVWAHSAAAPAVNGPTNNYVDQPIAAGATLHLQWRVAYASTSGNSYTAYVLADQDGKFTEGNETDNLGSLAWSVP